MALLTQLQVGSDGDQLPKRVLTQSPVGDLLPAGEAAREGVAGEADELVLLLLPERRVVVDGERGIDGGLGLLSGVIGAVPGIDVEVVEDAGGDEPPAAEGVGVEPAL